MFLQVDDNDSSATLNEGDTIKLRVTRINFNALVPKLFSKFIPSQLSADASMRYDE